MYDIDVPEPANHPSKDNPNDGYWTADYDCPNCSANMLIYQTPHFRCTECGHWFDRDERTGDLLMLDAPG